LTSEEGEETSKQYGWTLKKEQERCRENLRTTKKINNSGRFCTGGCGEKHNRERSEDNQQKKDSTGKRQNDDPTRNPPKKK